jgi:anthraniloyl-CoA monooxygenase
MMKIDCVGAGPGSLYFAILAKLRSPQCRVRIFERNPANRFPGWGVVLDHDIRATLSSADPQSAAAIDAHLHRWDTIDVLYQGRRTSSSGYAFGCISRRQLLSILRSRCLSLGVELHDARPMEDPEELDADLIVAGDGIRSLFRERLAPFLSPRHETGRNYYMWCGTPHRFAHFTFAFYPSPKGWFWAQAYQYDERGSTFIAECDERAYQAFGLEQASADDTRALLHDVFGELLAGATLDTGASTTRVEWRRFQHIRCERWYWRNLVLLGDAAHTTHFSLGSGTKLALEDAIALASHLFTGPGPLEEKLEAYQLECKSRVEAVQKLADRSNRWFEHLDQFGVLDARRFACALLMRTHFTGEIPSPERIDRMLALAGNSSSGAVGATGELTRLMQPLNLSVTQ